MGVALVPVSAGAFAAGLLCWPAPAAHLPAWAWIVLGLAASAGGGIAVSMPAKDARRPLVVRRAGAEPVRAPAPLEAIARGPRDVGGARAGTGAVALVLLGLVFLGAGWAGLWQARLDRSVLVRAAPAGAQLQAAMRSDPTPTLHGWGAIVDVSSISTDGAPLPVRERAWLWGRGEPPPAIVRGDRVAIEGDLQVPDDPGFATALRRRGIAAIVSADEIGRVGPSANPFVRAAQGLRRVVSESMRALFPEREAGLLLGLVLGDDTTLDPELDRDFRAAGLSHLLVASGGNVAIVLVPVLWALGLLRTAVRVRVAIGVVVVGTVVLVTGAEPSVLRAGVMAGLALVGLAGGRPRSAVALVGGAGLILLLLDPGLVWSVGFQLSIAATLGLALLAAPLADRLAWMPRPLALAVATTIAAQLGVTPLLLFHFREVPGTTLIANVVVFPLLAPALLCGIGAAGAGLVWAPLGRALVPIAMVPLRILELVADRAAKAPVPALATGGGWAALLLASAAVAAVVWRLRSGRVFPVPARVAAAATVPILAWWIALGAGPPAGLEVRFLDVGQGDAALVSSPGGARILIDGGPDPDQVASELAALGVRRLDLVVASHPHADHIVGLPAVFARFPVSAVLEPGCPDEEGALRPELVRAVEEEGLPMRHPRAGAVYQVGDVRLDVLSPAECFSGTESDLNNDALVVRASWGGGTVLFATEPEEPAQQAMLEAGVDLRADVLKVPHHGAATSVPEFFQAVGAGVAIVSVGENSYGHPVASTLDELSRSGSTVYRTDLDGEITVTLGPEGVGVTSSR